MRALSDLLTFWMDPATPIGRGTYLRHGLALAAVKYAGDAAIVWTMAGRVWTPLDYLGSVYSLLSYRVDGEWVGLALGIWTLPFVWLGVTLTLRRVLDSGRSGWGALFFFVPYANYLVILLLCFASTDTREGMAPAVPCGSRLRSAILASTAGVAIGIVATVLLVTFREVYSAGLFLGVPFVMGAATAFLFNRGYGASVGETVSVTALTFVVAGLTAVLFATEGVICIMMAFPLATGAGMTGAVVGRTISRHRQNELPPAVFALFVLSAGAAAAPPPDGGVVFEVRSEVEIAAPPEQVWPHVIAFDPIPEPSDALFRLGVAYPQRASISGDGVGAIRHCVFSTGAFVEPITAWDPGRRLSFDVVAQPPPLRELSPYRNLSPPHLDGYLRARRGEFRLVALPGGRTRLEGSTWYVLEIGPEMYWRLFSDYFIQRIHRRVLDHIRTEVEGHG